MREPERYDYKTRAEFDQAIKDYKEYERKKIMKAVFGIGGAVVAGLVALTVLGGSWYTVDQGERGILLRGGKIIGTADAGYGLKLPIIDSVARISIRDNAKIYENLQAYSRDQQTATISLSVTYTIPAGSVEEVYSRFESETGLISRLVDRQVNEIVREVMGKYNAVNAVQQRDQLGADISIAVTNSVVGPLIITGVQLENIDFSDAYEESIEQRMLAEVEVQKIQQNAEREKVQAEIRVIQANAEAEARVAQATAEAEAITMTGDAEASAIRARGAALRDNPALIELVQAERWNGILPTTMVPGSAVPFLNVGK